MSLPLPDLASFALLPPLPFPTLSFPVDELSVSNPSNLSNHVESNRTNHSLAEIGSLSLPPDLQVHLAQLHSHMANQTVGVLHLPQLGVGLTEMGEKRENGKENGEKSILSVEPSLMLKNKRIKTSGSESDKIRREKQRNLEAKRRNEFNDLVDSLIPLIEGHVATDTKTDILSKALLSMHMNVLHYVSSLAKPASKTCSISSPTESPVGASWGKFAYLGFTKTKC